LFVFCCALLAACGGKDATDGSSSSGGGSGGTAGGGRRGGGAGNGPVPVAVATAVQKAMPVNVKAVGTVESQASVQVRSQVTGPISEVHFREGDDVTAGQPLFVIDPQPFQIALDQATAILARDTAQAANAKAMADRYKTLFDRGLVPREQFDTQSTSAAALDATVAADRAAVEAAKLNLQHTRINAPVSGRTGSLMAHQGDLIVANATAPMVVINQITPVYVSFAVSGKLLDDIRRFQARGQLPVVARAPTEGEQAQESGRVTFIDNGVDPQTGTIRLKGTFANANRALWPGQFVEVSMQLTSEPRAVVVPTVAVQSGQQGQFVYVVNDNKAQLTPVTVDRTEGVETVIATGLHGGERVVTDGQLRLTPGARVAMRSEGSSAEATTATTGEAR
jgi:multidrug efflux system membrane fusion protein